MKKVLLFLFSFTALLTHASEQKVPATTNVNAPTQAPTEKLTVEQQDHSSCGWRGVDCDACRKDKPVQITPTNQ